MSETGNQVQINSIVRATTILELFGKLNVQYLGVAEISKELGLHKTTVFRVVKTLESQGWLIQDIPCGKYKLSAKVIALASSVTRNFSVDDLIRQEMKHLRDQFNEDVVLTGMIDDVAVCLEKIRSNNALRVHSKVGRSTNLVRGSTGKTLLAYLPQDLVERVLDRNFPRTEAGDQQRQELLATLEEIRRVGYCTSTSELDQGISSVTVPVFCGDGKILYSLAILGEEHRMKQKGMEIILSGLRDCAYRLQTGISAIDEN